MEREYFMSQHALKEELQTCKQQLHECMQAMDERRIEAKVCES